MEPGKKAILDALGASVAQKRATLEQLGLMNAWGQDEVTRMQMSMRYAQAQRDLWSAEADLRAAIARYSAPKVESK